jgi:hypothetical protein
LDLALHRLVPIEEAHIVLPWNRREIEGDQAAIPRQMQRNVHAGSALCGPKLHDAPRLEVPHNMDKNHQFVRHDSQIAREGMKKFRRPAEINLGEDLRRRNARNL